MKLKIILIVLVAFFACAFAVSPRVLAEGEITTTQGETLTTEPVTTVDPIQAEIDAQLAKAQNLIMSGVVSLGGASAVGGVVSIFLAKRRKQIEDQIAVAKDANTKAKAAYDSGKEILVSKFDTFQAKQEEFQKALLAKYNDALGKANEMVLKANEQTAKATSIIATYQQREEALAVFVKAEADEAAKAIEAAKLAAVATATATVQKVSVECGKE